MLIKLNSLSPVLVMINNMSYLSATVFTLGESYQQNNVFLDGVPLFDAVVRGDSLTQEHKILSR